MRTIIIAGAGVALATLALAQSGTSPDQAAITDLVLANRILASDEVGILNMHGHVSYRSRSNPSRFFIARHAAAGLVTARDIYESDLDGRPVAGNRTDLYPERFIDAEIYKARPEVMAIVTAEAPEFVAFSVSSVPVHGAAPAVADVRTFSGGDSGLVSTPALGESLAQALGRRNTILLRGRGAVITGTTINGVVGAATGLRESMRTQLTAAALGGKITYLDFTPRPAGTAPQQAGRGARANTPADPTAGDRPWNYWKYLANADLARERGEAGGVRAASPAAANMDQSVIDEVVLASRILSTTEAGILGAYGHVSARSRTNPKHYFISTDRSPGSITAADMIENDLDSRAAVPTDKSQFQEVYIHGEIYKARPDVMAVLHAHTPELVSFGLSSVRLRSVLHWAGFIGSGLPNYDIRKYTGGFASPVGCAHCISTPELGRALAQELGSRGAALLFGHGIAVVAGSLPELVNRAYDMRMNAVIQQMALSLGGTVNYLGEPASSNAGADAAAWEYWKGRASMNR